MTLLINLLNQQAQHYIKSTKPKQVLKLLNLTRGKHEKLQNIPKNTVQGDRELQRVRERWNTPSRANTRKLLGGMMNNRAYNTLAAWANFGAFMHTAMYTPTKPDSTGYFTWRANRKRKYSRKRKMMI